MSTRARRRSSRRWTPHAITAVETQRCALSSLTPWMFLVPVFGLVVGIVLLSERPNLVTLAGIVLVLASMRVSLKQHGIAVPGPGHLHVADSGVPAKSAETIEGQSDERPRSGSGYRQDQPHGPDQIEGEECPLEVRTKQEVDHGHPADGAHAGDCQDGDGTAAAGA